MIHAIGRVAEKEWMQLEHTSDTAVIETPPYITKSGVPVGVCEYAAWQKLFGALTREYGLTQPQIAEAASFSMAMVVRAALGLSAAGGRTCALVTDSLAGQIGLATMRHLAGGGADPLVVFVAPPEKNSPEMEQQLHIVSQMGIPIYDWVPSGNEKDLSTLLASCHNSILAVGAEATGAPFQEPLVSLISDLATPFHCIQSPLGINPENGQPKGSAVFASSTLSLGVPLAAMVPASEYAGRHYLCDISIPRQLYAREGLDMNLVFADQPVVQLVKPEAVKSA